MEDKEIINKKKKLHFIIIIASFLVVVAIISIIVVTILNKNDTDNKDEEYFYETTDTKYDYSETVVFKEYNTSDIVTEHETTVDSNSEATKENETTGSSETTVENDSTKENETTIDETTKGSKDETASSNKYFTDGIGNVVDDTGKLVDVIDIPDNKRVVDSTEAVYSNYSKEELANITASGKMNSGYVDSSFSVLGKELTAPIGYNDFKSQSGLTISKQDELSVMTAHSVVKLKMYYNGSECGYMYVANKTPCNSIVYQASFVGMSVNKEQGELIGLNIGNRISIGTNYNSVFSFMNTADTTANGVSTWYTIVQDFKLNEYNKISYTFNKYDCVDSIDFCMVGTFFQ